MVYQDTSFFVYWAIVLFLAGAVTWGVCQRIKLPKLVTALAVAVSWVPLGFIIMTHLD